MGNIPLEKPHFLRGAATEVNDLFDQIEVLMHRHGPPTDFPDSLFTARLEAVAWLVHYDLIMTNTLPMRRRLVDIEI